MGMKGVLVQILSARLLSVTVTIAFDIIVRHHISNRVTCACVETCTLLHDPAAVSAVGGSIVQSVGAGNNAVIKIGGLDAMTVSSTDTAISEDGVVVESSVTQTIGTASIKVDKIVLEDTPSVFYRYALF